MKKTQHVKSGQAKNRLPEHAIDGEKLQARPGKCCTCNALQEFPCKIWFYAYIRFGNDAHNLKVDRKPGPADDEADGRQLYAKGNGSAAADCSGAVGYFKYPTQNPGDHTFDIPLQPSGR